MRASIASACLALAAIGSSEFARGQGAPPLVPLPAPVGEPPAPAPSSTEAPPAAPAAPPAVPPAVVYGPPPPPVVYIVPEPATHAPRYALWLGGRLGLLAYGGGLYVNDQMQGSIETTGNFVRPGLALELDVGARLAKRYIPYLVWERGLVGAGRRFTSDTTAQTSFLGIGFRFLAGDVDSVAFASDLSFGVREFQVSNGTGTWNATGLELLRLGLGAEVRVSTRFTFSPMITLSGGDRLTDTSGNISFAPNQGDGKTGPPFTGNASIPQYGQTTYFAIVLGCGAHFDLLGN